MPSIHYAGSEGEIGLFTNTLDVQVGADDKRRGTVPIDVGSQLYRAFDGTVDTWVHVRCFMRPMANLQQGTRSYISVRDTTGLNLVSVNAVQFLNGAESRFEVVSPGATNGGNPRTSETMPHPQDEYLNYDINIKISTVNNANDTLTVRFYRNEVLRFTHTATDATGWSLPAGLLLQPRSTISGNGAVRYQDVIITDALPTVGMELVTLVPSAVGQFNQFTKDYASVNGPGYDSSTVMSTSAAGERESWILAEPTFDLGDKVIYGVLMTTVAQTDLAGIVSDFRPFLRINATEYNGPDLGADNVSPDAYTSVWTNNPATTQPWQQSDLIGLEAGLLSI